MQEKNNKVKIRENSFLAKLGAKKLRENRMALTFGNTIHLYNVSKENFLKSHSWVCHELKHVEQYRLMGFWKFLGYYLYYSAKYGYYHNPLEVEARHAESDTDLLARFDLPVVNGETIVV